VLLPNEPGHAATVVPGELVLIVTCGRAIPCRVTAECQLDDRKRTARVNWRMSLRGRLLWVVNCQELISLVRMCVRLTGRPVHRPFRGLLDVHSWSGLHTRAVTAIPDTLHRRLQPFRYLRSRSSCCPLWRLPRRTCTLESAAFSRRTPGGAMVADAKSGGEQAFLCLRRARPSHRVCQRQRQPCSHLGIV
jgi:hypothetical protein